MTNHAMVRGISLYEEHSEIIDVAATELGIRDRPRYISPAIQFIIKDWARMRGVERFSSPQTQPHDLRPHQPLPFNEDSPLPTKDHDE
jgi:hypothetical protein